MFVFHLLLFDYLRGREGGSDIKVALNRMQHLSSLVYHSSCTRRCKTATTAAAAIATGVSHSHELRDRRIEGRKGRGALRKGGENEGDVNF